MVTGEKVHHQFNCNFKVISEMYNPNGWIEYKSFIFMKYAMIWWTFSLTCKEMSDLDIQPIMLFECSVLIN